MPACCGCYARHGECSSNSLAIHHVHGMLLTLPVCALNILSLDRVAHLARHLWQTLAFWMRDEILDWDAAAAAAAAVYTCIITQECVLNSLEGCKRLVSLSHDTMLHICRSCGTKVAYESSIVAAITLWYTAHPTASQQQLQELASTVCLRGLPGMFMASVVGRLSWWKQAMGEGQCWLCIISVAKVSNATGTVCRMTVMIQTMW